MGCRPKLPSSVWCIVFALSSSASSLAFFLSFLLRCNCVKMLISPYVISVISKRQAARQRGSRSGQTGPWLGRVGGSRAVGTAEAAAGSQFPSRIVFIISWLTYNGVCMGKKWEDSQASSEQAEAACLRGCLTASVSTPTRTHTLDV